MELGPARSPGLADLSKADSLRAACSTEPMASPDRLGTTGHKSKTWVTNLRVTIAERDHLKQVASERSLTVSELIRQALAKEGALPAQ